MDYIYMSISVKRMTFFLDDTDDMDDIFLDYMDYIDDILDDDIK